MATRKDDVTTRSQCARILFIARNFSSRRVHCSARNSTAPQIIAPLMATTEITADRVEMFFMAMPSTMTLKNSEPVAAQQLFKGFFKIEPDCNHDVDSTGS